MILHSVLRVFLNLLVVLLFVDPLYGHNSITQNVASYLAKRTTLVQLYDNVPKNNRVPLGNVIQYVLDLTKETTYTTGYFYGCTIVIALDGHTLLFGHFAQEQARPGTNRQEMCIAMTNQEVVEKNIIQPLTDAQMMVDATPNAHAWIITSSSQNTIGHKLIHENLVEYGVPDGSIESVLYPATSTFENFRNKPIGKAVVQVLPKGDGSGTTINVYIQSDTPTWTRDFDCNGNPFKRTKRKRGAVVACRVRDGSTLCPEGQAKGGEKGECEECPPGEHPNGDRTRCEATEEPLDKPPQGKCKDGQVLDPAEGDQTSNTPDPVCKDDPSKQCPAGQVPASPDRDNPKPGSPRCGKDVDEKDKPRCSKTQYSFVEVDEKGSAKYSCKNTRKADGKAGNRSPAPEDPDEGKKRARSRFCLAFMAGSGLVGGAEELQTEEGKSALSDSATQWPDGVQYKDANLTDSNVDIDLIDSTNRHQSAHVTSIEEDIAKRTSNGNFRKRQFAAIFDGLEALAKGVSRGDGAAGSSGDVAKTAAEDAARAASRGGKGEAAQPDAAKVSELNGLSSAERQSRAGEVIKKIRDDPGYVNCLDAVAVAVADAELHIDGVPQGGFKPEENLLLVILNSNIDGKEQDKNGEKISDNTQVIYATHNDAFWHNNRINEFECKTAGADEGTVSAYNVTGGCCVFYRDDNCAQPLFSASDRQDMDLPKNGPDNDLVSSVACTFDRNCAGVPGRPGGINPNEYAPGSCGIHVTQYQRGFSSSPSIQFDVSIKDANGKEIGSISRADAADDLAFDSRLPAPGFSLTVHGDKDVDFRVPSGTFNSDKGVTSCKFGDYDGNRHHAGKRQGDCGFSC